MDALNVFAMVVVMFALVVVFGLIFGGYYFYTHFQLPREKREKEEAERQEKERIVDNLRFHVFDEFGVDLLTIHERTSQDEIVRLVNLVAIKTAIECVNYDKQVRGVLDCSWNYEGGSKHLKGEWAKVRNLALQIAPGLADRLPHFSEFEPLKSYNAEHIRQKEEAKKSVV